jgi:hypothetical protein
MPRYQYDVLKVACFEPVFFKPHDIRAAVEHLKTIEQRKLTGLQAETSTTAGPYLLRAKVLISLDEIIGKTPEQVWAMFDEGVDADRASLITRDYRSP